MKKSDKFILLVLAFAMLMLAATIGYRFLSEQYALPQTQAPTQTTKLASDFTVYDMDGNAVALSDFFGKPIVVNFWATWCGPCKSELPAFDTMYTKYKDEVHFLMVNLTDGSRETTESVTAFVKDGGYTFPVYFDTSMEAAYTYRVSSIPMTLFINADGQPVHTQIGAMSEETLEQYLITLIERRQ